MKKIVLLAGAAGLFLVSAAAVPGSGSREGELSSVVAAEAPGAAAKSPMERQVAAKPAPRVAQANTAYPRCSATVRDRCVQGRSGAQRGNSYARVPERRIQLASRAGERG
jgi:hypothetical protein